MTRANVGQLLAELRQEHDDLVKQQEQIAKRLAQLESAILGLMALEDIPVAEADWGLADGCRMVLRASSEPLSAIAIRQNLMDLKYDLSKHTNPLASIYSVLKRLVDSGEATSTADGRYLSRNPESPMARIIQRSIEKRLKSTSPGRESLARALARVRDEMTKVPPPIKPVRG